ncbi:MAG: AmmeMemoRadiSam system protein B [Melioribacteraceae bacterium]|nr:AmmeMemoRadiSam system protein B [Melioribacteraceae bacterium]MCF8265570.1 AmmeMemoRadiSam system protein B [Melioribacteraceae bacterium]MCF8413874.1 AmmeMemoRadiSam system protein B [Melioribacteraceae bacterium]MCF8430956.1 AmmeMemoRadiSam system protein B [Melioribacteraceae bacterium]
MIREPAFAGTFYPGSETSLKNTLQHLFESSASEENYSNIKGIISPHAGYPYSGKTASFVFNKLINQNFETAIIISPSHHEYFEGCSIYDGDAYGTPLGSVPVNKTVTEKLVDSNPMIFEGVKGHRQEHGIEVIIPFLQYVSSDFSFVPIVMGDQNKIYVDGLADSLSDVIDDRTLVIASTDLSHFYSHNNADKLDSVFEKRVREFDFDNLEENLRTGECEACGGGPTLAVMKALHKKGIVNSKVMNRTDSGLVSGDLSNVVGYLSALFY